MLSYQEHDTKVRKEKKTTRTINSRFMYGLRKCHVPGEVGEKQLGRTDRTPAVVAAIERKSNAQYGDLFVTVGNIHSPGFVEAESCFYKKKCLFIREVRPPPMRWWLYHRYYNCCRKVNQPFVGVARNFDTNPAKWINRTIKCVKLALLNLLLVFTSEALRHFKHQETCRKQFVEALSCQLWPLFGRYTSSPPTLVPFSN